MTASPNSSDDWQELLAGYILGNLSPEELIQFRQYLERHPEARVELERLQKTLTLIPLGLTEGKAPASLKGRIRESAAAATEELEILESISQTSRRPSIGRGWQKIAIAITAATIAILGFQTYRLQQQVIATEGRLAQLNRTLTEQETVRASLVRYRETIDLLHEPNNRLLSLAGSTASVKASGSLILIPQQKIAVLVLQNVPDAPPRQLYQMWAVVDGKKVSCIKFKPDRDGTVFLKIPADGWVGTPMVVITLEPEGETPQPKGDMVITSPSI
jgi:anti-sigma-K factor RskA